nr:probable alpha-mannosidase At5g13980 [Tanacetum cinerariifolium]
MSILRGQKSVHGINSRERGKWKEKTTRSSLLDGKGDNIAQHQYEVNEIRAEKIARVANPLALVAQQQQAYHPQTHPTHFNQNSSTRTHQAATKNRGKAVVNSLQPIYDQEPSMVDDDEDMSKDKEIDKLMALISLSFKKIYKPTNNNLRTSSNTSRANQDNSPRIYRNAGYEGQRSSTVAGVRDTVGSSMVQKSEIQCYNCKEYGHVARECQKPKRAKDGYYHKAAPHYIDMIEHMTFRHKFIKKQFNITPRIVWQIDSFGHSVVHAFLLGAKVGFDSLFFVRIDYQDRSKRKGDKHVEVIWWYPRVLVLLRRGLATVQS